MGKTTAKVFVSGRSQAVCIPKKFRFNTNEVFVEREGDRIVLTPRPKSIEDLLIITDLGEPA